MKNSNEIARRLGRLKEWMMSFRITAKLVFIVTGIASTLWFLIRVIPKPQRAAYPCMRAAAPIMSGFITYVLGLGGMSLLFKKSVSFIKKARYWSALAAFFIGLIVLAAFNMKSAVKILAGTTNTKITRGVLPDSPNTPVGDSHGIFPGRVAWAWNPAATNENCTNSISDAFFMAKNTNQDTINKMANDAIRAIGGKSTVSASWDAIFKDFNKRKTGNATGYVAGQKIFFKINNGQAGWAINNNTLAEVGETSAATGAHNIVFSEASPQAVLAFLVQLIDSCGVAQSDIEIAEPMSHIYQSLYDIVNPIYPNVVLLDKSDKTSTGVSTTSLGRTVSTGWKSNAIKWSDKGKVMTQAVADDMMNEMYNADYMINLTVMKAHARSGITLCAKNHFGSSTHGGSYSAERLHSGSINITSMSAANGGNDNLTNARGDYHMYRVLTDIIGDDKLGGNTVLFIADGLWGGVEATDMPVKWKMPPFNNDFPNSLFISQDEVALESVCIDFLRAEADVNTLMNDRPFFPGVDDYLHQAATRADWPDSIISLSGKWYPFAGYDPEGDGTLMPSMGIHEHWNNSTAKQYSRNLFDNGTGIELVSFPKSLVAYSNGTALNLTITVTGPNGPVEGAIVVIKGSNYMTDADGKVTIGDLTATTGLNYTISRRGYSTITGQVDISSDKDITEEMSLNGQPTSGIDGTASSSTIPFSAYPNPVTDECEISYSLQSSAVVSLSVTSMDGRVLQQLVKGPVSEGDHTQRFYAEDLKSGIYLCVLRAQFSTKTEIRTFKLVVR